MPVARCCLHRRFWIIEAPPLNTVWWRRAPPTVACRFAGEAGRCGKRRGSATGTARARLVSRALQRFGLIVGTAGPDAILGRVAASVEVGCAARASGDAASAPVTPARRLPMRWRRLMSCWWFLAQAAAFAPGKSYRRNAAALVKTMRKQVIVGVRVNVGCGLSRVAKPNGRVNARPMTRLPRATSFFSANELVGTATSAFAPLRKSSRHRTISSSIASPPSTSSSSVTREKTLAPGAPLRASRGMCTNRQRRGPSSVTRIRSRGQSIVARDSCRHRARRGHRGRADGRAQTIWRCAGRTSLRQCRRRSSPCVRAFARHPP